MPGPRTVLYVQHYPDGGSITGLLDLIGGLDPTRYRPLVTFRTPNAFLPEFEAADIPFLILDGSSGSPGPSGSSAPVTGTAPWADPVPEPRPALPRSTPLRREVRRLVRRVLPGARLLRRVILDHDIDLVSGNNDVLSNRDAIIAAWSTRRPIVVHGRWLHPYQADLQLRIDRFLARRVARLVHMSEVIAESSEVLGIPPERQMVLDDPFAVEDYEVVVPPTLAAELGVPQDARTVLHVGRIIEWKGQDVFLRAMAEVVAAEPRALALLVGAPTDDAGRRFGAELQSLATELGIADRVVWAGSRRDVPELIALAEVVVHSSTRPEPFGRVVVEGMAGARPVIGARAGGVPEIIDDGTTGYLADPGDHSALAKLIIGLLADPEAAAAMGLRARAAARERFSVERYGKRIQALYDEVLGPPS